ncbi:hypothetical protein K443DRAFT_114347 [Laccaria amethystina LaAM-08-1]|uniref:Uncharacterized protein n=1 Tax=Laccaria amethystina LaAM-08-1 TaxID=1095629 RepID=A0A0C9WHX2_9AGAR|nr:hypothetical protein K443DRAFT_114347 [Laccaria amethystina LaAM-08-1]
MARHQPCQLNRHMENTTWHINGPLQVCHVVQMATTHPIITFHCSSGEHFTLGHRNTHQPLPRHRFALCHIR